MTTTNRNRTGKTDGTRTAAAKTATKDRNAARATKDAAQTAQTDGTPYVLTPQDVADTFAHVRRGDAGDVIHDRFGAPRIETDRDGTVSGAAMARIMGLDDGTDKGRSRAKAFRQWLRDEGLPRQAANADDAARIMRAYQTRVPRRRKDAAPDAA